MLHQRKLDSSKSEIVAQWYEKYRLLIYKIAMKKVQNQDTANDILQETFLKLINNFDRVNSINDFQRNSYVAKTTISVINDFYRKKDRMVCVEDITTIINECNLSDDTTLEKILLNEQIETVAKCMEKLDERDRDLIQCRYVYQMSAKEISEMLGIPREYISQYVKRAKRRLIIAVGGVKDEK